MDEPAFKEYDMEDGTKQVWGQLENGEWVKAVDYYRRKTAEAESPWMAALVGAGKSIDDTITGISQLFGGEGRSEEEKAGYEALSEAHKGATAVGEFGGDLAQIVAPGMGATKAMTGLGMFAKSPIAAATAGDVLASLGLGLAHTPEGGVSRGERGGVDALWALGGGALGKLAAGSRIGDDARKLMDEGVYLSPGQATDSQTIQALESAMEVTPFTARGTKAARARGQQEFREKVMEKVGNDLGVKVSGTETGQQAFKKLDDAWSQGYRDAFSQIDIIPVETPKIIRATANKQLKRFGKKGKNLLKQLNEEIRLGTVNYKAGAAPGDVIDQMDAVLRQAAKTHGRKNKAFGQAIGRVRQAMYETLPDEVVAKLSKMDELTPEVKMVQKAVAKANKTGRDGGFAPQEILGASGQVAGERAFARGDSPLYDFLNAGQKTVGRNLGGQPLEWFRRLAAGAPSPAPMETMGDILMGSSWAQKEVASLPQMLLNAANPATVLPASAEQDEEDELIKLIRALKGG
jgi:hypothetical protein